MYVRASTTTAAPRSSAFTAELSCDGSLQGRWWRVEDSQSHDDITEAQELKTMFIKYNSTFFSNASQSQTDE